MTKNIKYLYVLFVFCALISANAFADHKYRVSDLGTLNMGSNEAVLINEFSEICIRTGKYEPNKIASGNFLRNKPRNQVDTACYVWTQKTGLKHIGNGQGFRPVFFNDLGQVVGYEKVSNWSPTYGEAINYITTIYNSQTGKKLSTLGNAGQSMLISANDNGQIVFLDSSFQMYDHGVIKQIDDCKFEYWDYPVLFNNKLELFGTGKADYGYQVAKYSGIDFGTTVDINPSMKRNFYSVDVNNLGQCIVYWRTAKEEGAFLWPLGKEIPANSRKINDKGQILAGDTTLIEANGEVIDVNKILDLLHDHSTPFERIEYIHDINNHGQMVGRGIVNGKPHAVLISPVCYECK